MSARSIHSIRDHTPPASDFKSEKESQVDTDNNQDGSGGGITAGISNTRLQQIVTIYALMATFLAAIKVALMSLYHDMLNEGEQEDTWVYLVWALGFCADVTVAYQSAAYGVTSALGGASWVRRGGG
ncbi:hypothetical protein RSOLAG22IIIB_10773 [Rhizoctonia solani]|uniref:Uncharacterized protein n=1 Tax=Rhizoctonia solani TaxID=456999 RepID=A0A0K6G4K2_9AGAM|nr:hypothetical protein RSOLAG22IIIB_10773 [Rhizoctonia solani]